jgi:predicted ester cyclase
MGLPATGRELSIPGLNIFRVEDGRITERWTFLDVVALLPQLGATLAPAG